MAEPFAEMLRGGHHNSLGRTEEVVVSVLNDPARLRELFVTVGDPDELVRMRAGDALEKICRERPGWLAPHIDRVIDDLGAIDQPSIQWHVAQILQHLRGGLSERDARRAQELLKRTLARSTDWIVLNVTMDVLTEWAGDDVNLAGWLVPELERLRADPRKSVARRAGKRLPEVAGWAAPLS